MPAAEKPAEDSENEGGDKDGAVSRDGVGIKHGGADDGKGDEQDGIAPPRAAQGRFGLSCFSGGDKPITWAGSGDGSQLRARGNGV